MSETYTSDIQQAAFYETVGYPVKRLEGSGARRVFVFSEVPPDVVADYHRGTRPVAPADLFSAYRRMKRLLFS